MTPDDLAARKEREDLTIPTILPNAAPLDQAAPRARSFGAREADIRRVVEAWARERWPGARICHELTLSQGETRIDLAAVGPDFLAVVEIKSGYDTMNRSIHQAGMSCLVADEVWMAVANRHRADSDLLRFLLPQVGMMRVEGPDDEPVLAPWHEAAPRAAHPLARLGILWREELLAEAQAAGLPVGTKHTRPALLTMLDARLTDAEKRRAVSRQLRMRPMLWRADDPLPPGEA